MVVQNQNLIGIAEAIAALGFAIPMWFLFRHHFRTLDFIQMAYIFSITLGSTVTSFSNNLDKSWLSFIPNFFTFCTTGEFICVAGSLISFGVCLAGIILTLAFIIRIIKCKKPQVQFVQVFSLLKTFVKWIYFPLFYYSISMLIDEIKKKGSTFTFEKDILARVVVTIILAIYPFAQLFYNKIIQKENDENIWIKWLEFFSFIRLQLVAVFLGMSIYLPSQIPIYFIYLPLIGYPVLYMFKQTFPLKFVGRIIFGFGQVSLIIVFSLFKFSPSTINSSDIDLFLISIVFLLDIIYYVIRFVRMVKGAREIENEKIFPQETYDPQLKKKNSFADRIEIQSPGKNKKQNNFGLQQSRESLDKTDRYEKVVRKRK